MMEWRAYFSDGTTYDSSVTLPEDLPSEGMVGAVLFHPECVPCAPDRRYRDIILGGDWYLWGGERWESVPAHPIPGRWVEREDVERLHPDKILVKSAPQLSDSEWSVLRGMMHADVEAP